VPIVAFEDSSVAMEIAASVEKEPILLHFRYNVPVPVLYIDYFENVELEICRFNLSCKRTYSLCFQGTISRDLAFDDMNG
jgi:hypothetical protein